MDSKYIQIPALGRPLYPGMLYDSRRDSFIPGVTLWDKNALCGDLDVHQQPKTNLSFAASDTLSDKANLLDISASLKASFLCGLVEIGGSAKYLTDTKSSQRQCRITMQHSQTTTFEQLTMKELGNITYPQVFEQKTATHVVTAVLYGAQAFMLFDYTTAKYDSKQDVEGNLHAVVKKIPTLSIEGQASLKLTDEEKKLADNISVTFYGDYVLDVNPTTYSEALDVYKRLPILIKQQQDKGVPQTVWLYPLTLLDNRAAKLLREISISLLGKTEDLLEMLGEIERRCNDLIKIQITDDFPDLKDRLLKFQSSERNYKGSFQKALFTVLPAIRGGEKDDGALLDILNIHYRSPFSANNMNKWLDDITTEINILSTYTSGLNDLTIAKSSGSVSSILLDADVDVVVCLSFTSLKFKDSYLAAIQDFENAGGLTMLGQMKQQDFSVQAMQPWFTSQEADLIFSDRMRQNRSLFSSFSKANKNEKRIKFIIASISDTSNPGTSIRLYQNGRLTDPKFQPVSKPPLPTGEIRDGKLNLNLSKSPTGETVQFRVESITADSAADDAKWTVTKTSDAKTNLTLTGLKPADQYWVRYRAVSNVGVSEASDPVPFFFYGKPDAGISKDTDSFLQNVNVKVDQSWDFSMSSILNKVRYKTMTNMGMSRWSVSTIKSEIANALCSPSNPYIDKIPGGLRAGMALYFQGVATGQAFSFNLLTGPRTDDDILFHFLVYINQYVGQNCCRSGTWDKNEEKTPECPISKGSAFDIFIVAKTEGYETYVNGQRLSLFKHRIPLEKVFSLYIHGDVIINIVGTVENWSTSTFAKEMNSGTSRTKISNIQSDLPQPVCNPRDPYVGSIPGGLRPGVALFFQGVVPSDCIAFEINLKTGWKQNPDTALHFNNRGQSIVLNSNRNGKWENYIETPGSPFAKGGAFDIIMVIKPDVYEVMVNGLVYYTMNHRVPVDKVNTICVAGDVFMNTTDIIEVDDVNLKFNLPAHV